MIDDIMAILWLFAWICVVGGAAMLWFPLGVAAFILSCIAVFYVLAA